MLRNFLSRFVLMVFLLFGMFVATAQDNVVIEWWHIGTLQFTGKGLLRLYGKPSECHDSDHHKWSVFRFESGWTVYLSNKRALIF